MLRLLGKTLFQCSDKRNPKGRSPGEDFSLNDFPSQKPLSDSNIQGYITGIFPQMNSEYIFRMHSGRHYLKKGLRHF